MSGKLELVNTFTGSSVSSLNLNACFTDTYEYYDVFFRGKQNADGSNPRPTVKILDDSNAELGAGNYDYASLEMYGHTSFSERRSTGAGSIAYLGNGDRNQAIMYVFNPADTGSYSFVEYQSSGGTSSLLRGEKGIGVLKLAAAHRGFKITANSGTYSDLNVSVYGVK